MNRALLVLCLLFCASTAYAMGECNGPGDDDCSSPAEGCQVLVEGSDAAAVAVCGALNVQVQRQICDPDAVCQQYVELVCGDVESICNSNDTLLAIAYSTARAKAACLLSHETAQSTAVACGDTAQTCGDLTSSVTQTCPPVNVTVDEADVDCAKCVKRVTYLKDGSVKSERERCFNCSVHGSLELN
jgi:hypothetical protein